MVRSRVSSLARDSNWGNRVVRTLLAAMCLTLLVPVLAACTCILPGEDCDPPRPVVTNRTNEEISLFSITPEGENNSLTIEPGDTKTLTAGVLDGCHRGPLVSRGEDG